MIQIEISHGWSISGSPVYSLSLYKKNTSNVRKREKHTNLIVGIFVYSKLPVLWETLSNGTVANPNQIHSDLILKLSNSALDPY